MAQHAGKGRKRRILEVEGALALSADDKKTLEDIKAGRRAGDWRLITDASFLKYPEFRNSSFKELFFNGSRTYWCRCADDKCFFDHNEQWFSAYNNTKYNKLEFKNHLAKRHNTSAVSITRTLMGRVQFKKDRIEEIRDALARFIAKTRSPLQFYESDAFADAMFILLKPWQINRATIAAFSPSRRAVVRSLERQADQVRELIFDKSDKLIENSGPAVLIDHHSSRGFQESTKKLGVALSFFDGEQRRVVMIGYREVPNSTIAANKELLERILTELNLAVPVASGIIPLISDFARDAVGLTRQCSPLTYQCATHNFAVLLQRALTKSFQNGSILMEEWKLLEYYIKGAKVVLEARKCPANGYRCLNTYLQSLKINPDDIENFSRLDILSRFSSLEMTEDQLVKEISEKTEAVRMENSEGEGKSCPIFVKLCDTRFRRFAQNVRTAIGARSHLRPLENDDHAMHYLLDGNRLPSDEFLNALAKISARLEALMNLYDSNSEITGRSLVNDYCELLDFLVHDINRCSLLEASLRRHFIKTTTEQMFDRFISPEGEIVTKPGTGVPTRIQDSHLGIEYLIYPRCELDFFFLKKKIDSQPSEYSSALSKLISEETAQWKFRAVAFLKFIYELQNDDAGEEDAVEPEPRIDNLSLSLHPRLQRRSNAVDEEEPPADNFISDLEKYAKMAPDKWFEVTNRKNSDAANARLFWNSLAARRSFPTLAPFASKLLLSCCPSSSGLERLFSMLAGLKRKDRKRLKATTQEKICIAGTSTASICYVKKL